MGPSVHACDTRKVWRSSFGFSASMRRNKFRSTFAANSCCASVASVDGHIVVHPWRCQRPASPHFNHSAAPRKGIHRDDPFLASVGHIGTRFVDIRHDPHRHALTCVLAIDNSEWAFCAVSPIDRNVIDEGSVLVAHWWAVRDQVFEHIHVDYAVLPVRLVPPESLFSHSVVVDAPENNTVAVEVRDQKGTR